MKLLILLLFFGCGTPEKTQVQSENNYGKYLKEYIEFSLQVKENEYKTKNDTTVIDLINEKYGSLSIEWLYLGEKVNKLNKQRRKWIKEDLENLLLIADTLKPITLNDTLFVFTSYQINGKFILKWSPKQTKIKVTFKQEINPKYAIVFDSLIDNQYRAISFDILGTKKKLQKKENDYFLQYPFFFDLEQIKNEQIVKSKVNKQQLELTISNHEKSFSFNIIDNSDSTNILGCIANVLYQDSLVQPFKNELNNKITINAFPGIDYKIVFEHSDYNIKTIAFNSTLYKDTIIKLVPLQDTIFITFSGFEIYNNPNYKLEFSNSEIHKKRTEIPFVLADNDLPIHFKDYWELKVNPKIEKNTTLKEVKLKRKSNIVSKTFTLNNSQSTNYSFIGFNKTENIQSGKIANGGKFLKISFEFPIKSIEGDYVSLTINKPIGYDIYETGAANKDWLNPKLTLSYYGLINSNSFTFEKLKEFNLVYVAAKEYEWKSTSILSTKLSNLIQPLDNKEEYLLFVSYSNKPFTALNSGYQKVLQSLPQIWNTPMIYNDVKLIKSKLNIASINPSRRIVNFHFFLTETSYYEFSRSTAFKDFMENFASDKSINIYIHTNFVVSEQNKIKSNHKIKYINF